MPSGRASRLTAPRSACAAYTEQIAQAIVASSTAGEVHRVSIGRAFYLRGMLAGAVAGVDERARQGVRRLTRAAGLKVPQHDHVRVPLHRAHAVCTWPPPPPPSAPRQCGFSTESTETPASVATNRQQPQTLPAGCPSHHRSLQLKHFRLPVWISFSTHANASLLPFGSLRLCQTKTSPRHSSPLTRPTLSTPAAQHGGPTATSMSTHPPASRPWRRRRTRRRTPW
jgi:hypothetical protein